LTTSPSATISPILGTAKNWSKLNLGLDRKVFIGRLDEMRKVRNDVLHFNPDPLAPEALNRLKSLVALVRQLSLLNL
jgi:hypothetical protein